MDDCMTPSDLPEGQRAPVENMKTNRRSLRGKVIWSLSGLLAGVLLIIVIVSVIITRVAPGTSGYLTAGQSATDHGLFLQVRSIALYKDRDSGQNDLVADIKLQNTGNENIDVYFGDTGNGDNGVLVDANFPGHNDQENVLYSLPGLPTSYQGQLLPDLITLRPGETMEGLKFFNYVYHGQKAASISFDRYFKGSNASFDWAVPEKGIQYLGGL